MKTKAWSLIILCLFSLQMAAFAGNSPFSVNEKLLKSFKETFPQAQTVDWRENGEYYFVHFKDHEAIADIKYDHEGNFVESRRFYTDAALIPQHLACEINKKFKGKSIYCITEINTEMESDYYVKLQDEKEWVTIKGNSIGIEEIVERFNKQK